MKTIISEYRQKRYHIKRRLKEFKRIGKSGDEDIFAELCFCILTPQSKAVACHRAVGRLRTAGLLLRGNKRQVVRQLKGLVRFHNNKARYIISARKRLGDIKDICRRYSDVGSVLDARRWLVDNIKGLGYKEASHFLRNVGLGKDIAIIDRHVLANLKRYRLIEDIPRSIDRKIYQRIEERMRVFARKVAIPLEELDLLFWSRQTGFVFK